VQILVWSSDYSCGKPEDRSGEGFRVRQCLDTSESVLSPGGTSITRRVGRMTKSSRAVAVRGATVCIDFTREGRKGQQGSNIPARSRGDLRRTA